MRGGAGFNCSKEHSSRPELAICVVVFQFFKNEHICQDKDSKTTMQCYTPTIIITCCTFIPPCFQNFSADIFSMGLVFYITLAMEKHHRRNAENNRASRLDAETVQKQHNDTLKEMKSQIEEGIQKMKQDPSAELDISVLSQLSDTSTFLY